MSNKFALIIFAVAIAILGVWLVTRETDEVSFSSEDGRLTVIIPQQTLSDGVTPRDISIRKLKPDERSEIIKALNPVGAVYRLEPAGVEFQQPVTLTFQLEEAEVADFQPARGTKVFLPFAQDSDGTLRVLDNAAMRASFEGGPVVVSGRTGHFSDVGAAPQDVELELNEQEILMRIREDRFDIYTLPEDLDPLEHCLPKEGPSLGEQFLEGSLGPLIERGVDVGKFCFSEDGLNMSISMDNPLRGGPEVSAAVNVNLIIDFFTSEDKEAEEEPEPITEEEPPAIEEEFLEPPLPEIEPELPGEVEIDVDVEVKSDPGGHRDFIGMPGEVRLRVKTGSITIEGSSPWVRVEGQLGADGGFNAQGRGTVAGFPNVRVEFEGIFTGVHLSGDYTMGAGGELPGVQAIIYRIKNK